MYLKQARTKQIHKPSLQPMCMKELPVTHINVLELTFHAQ